MEEFNFFTVFFYQKLIQFLYFSYICFVDEIHTGHQKRKNGDRSKI